jgi:hypothetical protein
VILGRTARTLTPQGDGLGKLVQGVTLRCRLSYLTNSALVFEAKCGGGGVAGSQPMSTTVPGAQINFEDLTPYLTYAFV